MAGRSLAGGAEALPRVSLRRLSTTLRWVAGLTAVGLTLRLVWVFYTDTIPLGGDPGWYYVVAINVAKGHGFVSNAQASLVGVEVGPGEPTAFWPPAYSLVLAGYWKVAGIGIESAKVLNAVLGALTIPFVYLLGRELYGRRVALAGAALFAVFPNAIAWVPVLFPEQLFVLLFVAALWLLVAHPVPTVERWWPLAAFGLLVGAATLTRGQGAVLVPIALTYWLMRAGWRPALLGSAVSLAAAAAIISPWTARNWLELDAFVPIATNSGAALRAGHAPDSIGTTKWTEDEIDGFRMDQSLYRPDWEVKGYREYTNRAIEYAFTHPGHELELTGSKIYHLYRTDSGVMPWLTNLGAYPIRPAALQDALPSLFDASYYGLLFAALAWAPLWLRRSANGLLIASVVAWWTVFHIVFLGEPRYHVPLYPVFAIAAAAVGAALLDRLHGRIIV